MRTRYFMLMLCMIAMTTTSGCVGLAVEGGEAVIDRSTIATEQTAANTGDPIAQYKMGDAYCCAARGDRSLFKDNEAATLWLCKAALQDYAPAKLRIARVYAGDRITGLALFERAVDIIETPTSNKPVALVWAKLAAAAEDNNVARQAATLAIKLEATLSVSDRQYAEGFISHDWRQAPCGWHDVFPPQGGRAKG